MTDGEFLKFNNGKKFSFSNFKEIREDDLKNASAEEKRLFNIFAGDDHVLQVSEAQSLFVRIKTAASSNKNGDNSIFENDEMQSFLDENVNTEKETFKTSVLSSLIGKIFKKPENNAPVTQTAAADEYNPEEIQDMSINTLSEDAQNARKVFDNQRNNQGLVSDTVDSWKEFWGTEYASSKVNRYLLEEELSANLLSQAKEGTLTERSYLEQKLKLAESLLPPAEENSTLDNIAKHLSKFAGSMLINLGIEIKDDNMSGDRKEQEIKIQLLRKAHEDLTPEELNILISDSAKAEDTTVQTKLLNDTIEKYLSNFNISTSEEEVPQKVLKGFKNRVTGKFTPYKEGVINSDSEKNEVPVYETVQVKRQSVNIERTCAEKNDSVGRLVNMQGDKIKTFEETFQDERGVEYNEAKILEYRQKETNAKFAVAVFNQRQEIYNILYKPTVTVDGNNKNGDLTNLE